MRLDVILKMKFECYISPGKHFVLNSMQTINKFVDWIEIFVYE